MRKGFILGSVAIFAIVVSVILSSCGDVTIQNVEEVYGSGWVANIDSMQNNTTPHILKIQNLAEETLTIKWVITTTSDLNVGSDSYTKNITEPDWDLSTISKTTLPSSTTNNLTNIFEVATWGTDPYAVAWVRVQDADNEHYVTFSVFFDKSNNTEWDVTIQKEKTN